VKSLVKALASSLGVEIRRRRPTEPPEPNAFEIQSRLIKRKNPVIFDVGACDGETSRVYRQLFPEATIHAFEPFPDSFAAMDRKFLGDKRHHRHQIALSNRAGSATLHSNIGAPTNSLLHTTDAGQRGYVHQPISSRIEKRHEFIEVRLPVVDRNQEDFCKDRSDTCLRRLEFSGRQSVNLPSESCTNSA
jgi:FkbM family methyltransferase